MAVPKPKDRHSPFFSSHQELTRLGYHVIPIGPKTKAPSDYRGGRWFLMDRWDRYRAEPAPTLTLRHWATFPDANIGVITGTAVSEGIILACIDYDTDDADVLDMLQSMIPASPVTKAGRRGHSAFYLCPEGTEGFRTPLCELLTGTRQTVIPPSIHPDTGQPYRWTGKKRLDEMPVGSLPLLTQDHIEKLRDTLEILLQRPVKPPSGEIVQLPQGEETLWRRINNTAYANLDVWVPHLGIPKLERTSHGYKGVAHWRASTTGRPIQNRNRNLSILQFQGAKDFGTGDSYTALDLVQAALTIDLDDAVQWLGIKLGMIDEPLPMPEPPKGIPAHDPETGEIIDHIVSKEEFPDALTRPPGLLGDLVDWITSTAQKPSRVLALGSAIAVLGTIIGRAIAGPTETGTHLYIVELAPTGANKNIALTTAKRLLEAANQEDLIGSPDFTSQSAMFRLIARKPLCLCCIDEIGTYLHKITKSKASTHEEAMSKTLREAWGLSFDRLDTPEMANLASISIDSPAMSILGVSTQEEFFAALTGADVKNGLLNRFLLLDIVSTGPWQRPASSPHDVPHDLAMALARLRTEVNRLPPQALTAPIGSRRGWLKKLAWGHEAEPVYEALRDSVLTMGDFHARTAEMAQRLAVIRAAGRMVDVVAREDIEWGRDVALWSANRMVKMAGDHMAENDWQRNYKRIRRIIEEKGGTMSRRDLNRYLNGSLRGRDLDEVIKSLAEADEIIIQKSIPARGGPPTLTYVIRPDE